MKQLVVQLEETRQAPSEKYNRKLHTGTSLEK